MSGLSLIHDRDVALEVYDGDIRLFRYVYAPDTVQFESPKPYIDPISTRSGRIVSLFRPHDHVWHKGIAWSLPHVGVENFWGGPTYVHGQFYVQLENNGRAQHAELTDARADENGVTVAHRLDWITQAGRTIIDETRRLSATLVDGGWALTFETTMRNVGGEDLWIGSPTTKGRENAGYGGLFWRGPRSLTGGRLRTATGDGGDELRGTRHEWMGYTGRHDGVDASSTLVVVDDAANPHHPPQWFARTEEFACICPAPFFSEEVLLAAGAELSFRYAVVIADGDAAGDAVMQLAAAGRQLLASPASPASPAESARS